MMNDKGRKMRTGKGNKKTMFRKMLVSVLLIAVLQVVISQGILLLSGTLSGVRNEKYNEMYDTMLKRADRLQDMMVEKRDLVKYYKSKLEGRISQILEEEQVWAEQLHTDVKLNEKIVVELSGELKDLLCCSQASGVFLVLDGYGEDDQRKYGYYLRSAKPGSSDNQDLAVFRGSEDILDKVGISTDRNWRSEFRITDGAGSNYYTKVRSMVEEEQYSSQSVGYWNPAFTMYADDQKVITYSIPLVDERGEFYGVLGIDLNEQLMVDNMPYGELSAKGYAGYYLAYREKESNQYQTLMLSASSSKDLTDKMGFLTFTDYKDAEHIYKILDSSIKGDYLGAVKNMELYPNQSPFSSQQWALVGVEDGAVLASPFTKLMGSMLLGLVFIVLLGVAGEFYICYHFIAYIRHITFAIQTRSPEKQLEIDDSDVLEIDNMVSAVKELHDRVTSSVKLVEIIDMTGILVGAIEYREEEELVFCTTKAAEILELHQIDGESQYISKKAFQVEMDIVKKKLVPYENEESTYCMISRTGADKWVRFQVKEEENRSLVAVLDVTAEILEKQRIEYERDYDILTRLLNRNAFRTRMGQLLKKGNLGIAAVVMMDLDNLKYFNDTYGHEYGDKYIREAAVVLSTLNQHDALVARMSGDEFLMFIYGYSDKDEIRSLVRDVHKNLQDSYVTVPGGADIRIRASAGIAWYPDDATFLDELIKYADFAMYQIKGSKKGAIKEFDKEVYQKDSVLFTGREELNHLLEQEGMVQYIFQPIVEVCSGEIFGYEALMRPQIDSLRSPEDVMRLARAQSKLYQVEKMTWMAALSAVERQRKHGDDFKIFINSVPNHVLDDKDTEELEKNYEHILKRVVIEIIESEQTDKSCMETKCEWAKKHGASIALDDFGTGYSNESTLLYIDPKYVKLDMSIITNIHKDEGRQKIVQGLLNYTKSHGIKVIAEGIDCYEEMHTLIRLGVDYMQGWYLARGSLKILDLPLELKEQIRECVQEIADEKEPIMEENAEQLAAAAMEE